MIVYSPSTNAFYEARHKHSPPIPDDAIEIGYKAHAALLAAKGAGDELAPGADGRPVLRRRQKPTLGECKANRSRGIRRAALAAINDALLSGAPLDEIRTRLQALNLRIDQAQTEDELEAVSWGS